MDSSLVTDLVPLLQGKESDEAAHKLREIYNGPMVKAANKALGYFASAGCDPDEMAHSAFVSFVMKAKVDALKKAPENRDELQKLLLTAVHTHAKRRYRDILKRKEVVSEELDQVPAKESLDDQNDIHQVCQQLFDRLKEILPERPFLVMLLKYNEGYSEKMSTKAIANHLKLSSHTIERDLKEAEKAVRREMERGLDD